MPQTIMSFDPGYTTGIAIRDDNHLLLLQIKGLSPLWRELEVEDPDVIVYEKFFYQRRDKVDLRPVEAIGVIKLYAEQKQIPIAGQSPQMAKRFWTDAKVKKLDLWVPGEPHAMDALRHLLYYEAFVLHDQTLLERLK